MHVVYITTDSYVSMLGVSLVSLLENANDLTALEIYILSPDLSPQNTLILFQLASKYGYSIHFCNISGYEKYFSVQCHSSGFHPIILARLLLPQYLPLDVDIVLYLDSDTIIHDSLLPLEHLNLDKFSLAAVPELYMPIIQKRHLGLSANDTYFNSGVLLINLKYWRAHHLQQKFLNYNDLMQGNLLYNDQDILNHCCKGTVFFLPHKYNLAPVLRYFPRYFIKHYQPAYYMANSDEYHAVLTHPTIIHYLGDERPYFHGNLNPYRKLYQYYKSISPWKNAPLVYGRELYLFCYHILNCITFICPWFRKAFTRLIGIRVYKLLGKK